MGKDKEQAKEFTFWTKIREHNQIVSRLFIVKLTKLSRLKLVQTMPQQTGSNRTRKLEQKS